MQKVPKKRHVAIVGTTIAFLGHFCSSYKLIHYITTCDINNVTFASTLPIYSYYYFVVLFPTSMSNLTHWDSNCDEVVSERCNLGGGPLSQHTWMGHHPVCQYNIDLLLIPIVYYYDISLISWLYTYILKNGSLYIMFMNTLATCHEHVVKSMLLRRLYP